MKFRVRIDGVETTLTYDQFSGARGYQYLTPGNTSSHAFASHLEVGDVLRTNGHRYEVIAALHQTPWRAP